MRKRIDVKPGERFGRLVIIQESEPRDKRRYFLCKCDCENEKVIRLDSLRNGSIVSCGCFNREISKESNTIHGLYKTRIYRIWRAMKGRCLNKNNTAYKNYGSRGIKICEEWLDFNNFYNWSLNHGYKDHLTIERKNVNGIYEPGNCCWITMTEQKRNTTKTKRIAFEGKIMTLRQWANFYNLDSSTLCRRLNDGWELSTALKTPGRSCKKTK